jgi:hypothetical protein
MLHRTTFERIRVIDLFNKLLKEQILVQDLVQLNRILCLQDRLSSYEISMFM